MLARCISYAYDWRMNGIQRACEYLGGQTALAAKIDVKQPTVSEWVRGERPIPLERCVEIERATDRTVMRWDLRPEDWYRIWPELIGAEGAPLPFPKGAKANAAKAAAGASKVRV